MGEKELLICQEKGDSLAIFINPEGMRDEEAAAILYSLTSQISKWKENNLKEVFKLFWCLISHDEQAVKIMEAMGMAFTEIENEGAKSTPEYCKRMN